MINENWKSRMKQSGMLYPVLEFVIGGVITFISAIFCMWLCQFSCGLSLGEITTKSAFVIYISLYAIIFALVTIISGRIVLGNSVTIIFLFLVTMIDYQVYSFRGTEILPGEVTVIRTALGVAGNYQPQITVHLVIAVLLLILYVVILHIPMKYRKGVFWRRISLGVLVGAVVVFTQIIVFVPVLVFGNEGMKQSSFPVNFCRMVYDLPVEKPEGYSPEIIQELEETYQTESGIQKQPVIIAIMNESFTDLSYLGDLPVEEDILPFFSFHEGKHCKRLGTSTDLWGGNR